MKKRSFFDRITGSSQLDDEYDAFEDEAQERPGRQVPVAAHDEDLGGQLPIDVYQTPDEIIVRTFVAGVRPDELNVSISRDMVVIEGSREEREQVVDSDYFSRELFWGSFSRTVLLPQEVDVDASTATAKDGLLTLVLPKLDKTRQTKLRVRVG